MVAKILAAVLLLTAACRKMDADWRNDMDEPIDQTLRLVAQAGESDRSRDERAARLGGAQTIVGMVTSVEDGMIIVAGADQAPMTVRIHPSTVITIDGNAVEAADIPIGTEVRVIFKLVENKPVANRIIDTGRRPVRGSDEH